MFCSLGTQTSAATNTPTRQRQRNSRVIRSRKYLPAHVGMLGQEEVFSPDPDSRKDPSVSETTVAWFIAAEQWDEQVSYVAFTALFPSLGLG